MMAQTSVDKPLALEVLPDHIPEELKQGNKNVCWKYTPTDNPDKPWTKPLFHPEGYKVSHSNPDHWSPFEMCFDAYQRGGFYGIGFVLAKDDPYCAIDLDHCRDPQDGAIEPWALEIIGQVDSYTELSPSGTGVHIFIKGVLPEGGHKGNDVEVYDEKRYMTVTGHHLPGTPATIEYKQPELIEFLAKWFPPDAVKNGQHGGNRSIGGVGHGNDLDDDVLIQKAKTAKNGDRFQRLWDGDTTDYDGDWSRADMALCSSLAFWTSNNPEQIDRLFQQSGLYREKWDEIHYGDGRTYGQATIATAIGGTEDVYTRAKPAPVSAKGHEPIPGNLLTGVRLKFQTAREIASTTPEKPEWIIYGYAAKGAITEFDGRIKSAGKTSLLMNACRQIIDGQAFLGNPTLKAPVVYLTEQIGSSLREALRRADLLDTEDFSLLQYHDAIGVPWAEIVKAATDQAAKIGAQLLVIDTLPQWAGLRGDAENSSGEALAALEPLQAAAASGLAIILVRHERKGGGEIGESARGSSAFGGAVDVIVTIRRGDGNTPPTVRILEGLSRFDETPDQLVIDLRDGEYVPLGTTTQVAKVQARDGLLAAAPSSEGEAKKAADLIEDADVKKTIGREVISTLVSEGLMHQIGSGKRNDPYRYWKNEALLPEPPVVADERNEDPGDLTKKLSSAIKDEVPDETNFPQDQGFDSLEATHSSEGRDFGIHSYGTTTIYTEESNLLVEDLDRCYECGVALQEEGIEGYYCGEGYPWCQHHGPNGGGNE